MKVIILAAGVGSRISKDIKSAHKCLLPLPIGSKKIPLLIYTLETLKKYGVNDISVVTGYLHESIKEVVIPQDVSIFYNPFYELMNSIGSMWFCNSKLTCNDNILVLNADTFLEDAIIRDMIHGSFANDAPLLLVDPARKDCADVKVNYNNNNTLVEYGKEIALPSLAESLDVVHIPKNLVVDFKFHLQEMLENKQFDTWWESALINYMSTTPIQVLALENKFWGEIDFYADYERICEFCKTIQSAEYCSLSMRYQ